MRTTGVEHYDVYRTDPGHLTPVKVNPTPINGLVAGPYNFTDASATTQNTYTYTVVAVDGVGNHVHGIRAAWPSSSIRRRSPRPPA